MLAEADESWARWWRALLPPRTQFALLWDRLRGRFRYGEQRLYAVKSLQRFAPLIGIRRCGKGEGYSDLEFAILRELGHPPVPVATTVHDLQVVDSVPRDPTDQPLSLIATPTHAIRIKRPSAAPTGIDWTRLSAEDLEEMPILAELKKMTTSSA